jgi:hypothetical protein
MATADVRLMSSGTLRLPELEVGLPLPQIGYRLLRDQLGPHLRGIVNAGTSLDERAAEAIGFVDVRCEADDLLPSAEQRARALAAVPRGSLSAHRTLMRRELLAQEDAAADIAVAEAWASPEARLHIQKYLDRL